MAGALTAGALEGLGPRSLRPFLQVGGLIVLVAAGVMLTAWRVSTFPSLQTPVG